MSELSARLGLYSAIDQAVVEDRDRLMIAAQVIPLYRLNSEREPGDPLGTAGWDDARKELLPQIEVPPLVESLEEMVEVASESRVSALDQTRRLKAVWAVAWVLPEAAEHRDLLVEVLRPLAESAVREREPENEPDPDEVRGRAVALLDLILSDENAEAEAWPEMVREANDQMLVSSNVVALADVGCEDQVILIPVTHDGETEIDPVARINSTVRNFDVGARSVAEIKAAIAPGEWPDCLPSFWCYMHHIPDPTPDGITTYYQEEVGGCPPIWFDPYLRFAYLDTFDASGIPTGFELQYALAAREEDLVRLGAAAGFSLDQDDNVEVDTGRIIVEWRSLTDHNEIDITTTKSIRFRSPMPTGGVALLACISGWADMTRSMMVGCLGPT